MRLLTCGNGVLRETPVGLRRLINTACLVQLQGGGPIFDSNKKRHNGGVGGGHVKVA